ncbi:Flp pilus assembly protein, ATPase CpaE [Tsukamurella hominis]
MSDAATNVRVPFVPQSSHEDDSAAAILPSTDSAVPVVRPTVPTGGPLSEPASGEWEEPELPGVDDLDGSAAVPTAPAATPVVIAADERPTAEQPAIVDDVADTAKADGPKAGSPKTDAPKTDAPTNGTPKAEAPKADADDATTDAPKPDAPKAAAKAEPAAPSTPQAAKPVPAPAPVPQPQQPQQQWQGGQNGFVPAAAQNGQPQQAPFQGVPPTGQFQSAQASGQIHRPASPQPFGQAPAPVQGAPAPMVPQHQQAPMRPMGESLSAPMSTASSSFNQQIRFSDAAVRVSGWRAWLRKMGLDVGPSANDQEHAELVHRIRVPKNKFHVTSVFADNAGGTLLVGVLGQILERTRADNVVALDLDPDGGDLDQVTAWHQGGSTARTLIQQSDLSDRNQVDKHLAVTSTNLHVLPTPWRFNGRDVTDYDDVLDLYSIFRPHYSLALVDAGRGLQTQTGTGVLEISSALILPASATTRGVRKVAATIDWLRHHGWHGLLANTIVVINHTKRRGSVSVEQFDELFRAGQKLRVHEIPYDPHLDSDQPIDIDLLRKRTVRAFEELAADLADGFNSGYEPPAAQKLAELQQVRTTEGR